MKWSIMSAGRSMRCSWVFAGACCVLFYSHTAHAVLGAAANTIHADQIRYKGARSESASANGLMTTHEIRMSDGSGIKQYVNSAGVVFAVSWRTRLKPDLEALLGPRFALQGATVGAAAGVAGIKRQQSIRQPNLVVHQGGRMNAFAGLAYVPTLVPEGIDAELLR
ncbi:MAG: DUF2844 domain-containing protein [Betaproteobacteria bacterium]|nr:DUF2844 domain-containing protein [Betaproteobacteria bacterium]